MVGVTKWPGWVWVRLPDVRRLRLSVNEPSMAWGRPPSGSSPAADLIAKAATNASLVVLPFRSFGDAECVALCAALRGNQTLTELKASGHKLQASGLHAVGELLGSGECGLCRLAIGDSSLGGRGVRSLCAGLLAKDSSAVCKLHALDLSFKGLGKCNDDAEALAELLVRCYQLRELDLSRNPLGPSGWRALFTMPGLGGTLGKLGAVDLSDTMANDAALGELARLGCELPVLQSLSLARNPDLGGLPRTEGSARAHPLGRYAPALRP